MQFKRNKMYLCIHDVIINNKIAFVQDHQYKCIKPDILLDENKKEVKTTNFKTHWNMYFKEEFQNKDINKKSNIEQFKEITTQMANLYEKKNADYGNSFDKSCNEFGITAALVRMNDKFNRIKSLTKNDNLVKDESIEDTLIDLANYSIMTLIWYKNNHE